MYSDDLTKELIDSLIDLRISVLPELTYMMDEINSLFSWLYCEVLLCRISGDKHFYWCEYIETRVLEKCLEIRKGK